MKYLWLYILITAYGTWAIMSIIDIVKKVIEWIDYNTENVRDKNSIVPTKRKVWVNKQPLWEMLLDDLEGYTQIFIVINILILFLVSLVMWLCSKTTING